jgi:hypothetical protein
VSINSLRLAGDFATVVPQYFFILTLATLIHVTVTNLKLWSIKYSLSIEWLCTIIDMDRLDDDGCLIRNLSIIVVTITGVNVSERGDKNYICNRP